jgi:predicted transposase
MFVSLQFKLELKREDKEKLIKLMRKQSSAIRVAYNMLKDLEKEKTKNPHAQIYHRRGCKFTDKGFQPSEQVEERDYLTCLPLWLRYRL